MTDTATLHLTVDGVVLDRWFVSRMMTELGEHDDTRGRVEATWTVHPTNPALVEVELHVRGDAQRVRERLGYWLGEQVYGGRGRDEGGVFRTRPVTWLWTSRLPADERTPRGGRPEEGMAPYVARPTLAEHGEARCAEESDRRALLRHVREQHPNLLGSTLPVERTAAGGHMPAQFPLPTSGLSDVAWETVAAVHAAAHAGLWGDWHQVDDWLCRGMRKTTPYLEQALPGGPPHRSLGRPETGGVESRPRFASRVAGGECQLLELLRVLSDGVYDYEPIGTVGERHAERIVALLNEAFERRAGHGR